MTTVIAAVDGGSNSVDSLTTDLTEILDAVSAPVVVLRRDLTIACFNRAAADALTLASSDIGSSASAVSFLADLPDIGRWCAEVIATKVPTQHEIRAADRSFLIRIAPYTKSQISGAVLTFTNVTAFRASIDQAIYEREYTKAILNTVADPLVVVDADLHVLTANRAFYSIFRVSRDAIQGTVLNELNNKALDYPGLTQLTKALTDGSGFQPLDIDYHCPEAGRRSLSVQASQLSLPGYSPRMALLSFHDITERKRTEEDLRLLANEVDHRAKNLLALVQATVHFSRADTPDALKTAIEGRLQALSNAHTLLAQSRWTGANLRSLVIDELSPYCPDTSRAEVDGPDLILQSQAAQLITMVIHELTTNAVKYGALSSYAGRVRVDWSRSAAGKIVLRWTEENGPPVKPPVRQGFGTHVLDRVIRTQLNGRMRFDWRAQGLAFEIEMQT